MTETHTDDAGHATTSLAFKRPSSRSVLGLLAGVFGVLLVLDVAGQSSGLGSSNPISLDSDIAIGTWWASIQLALVSLVLLLLAVRDSQLRRRASARALLLGAAAAIYLSIDETASFHDFLARLLDEKFPHGLASVGDTWVIIYAVAAAIVLSLAAPGIASLLRTDRQDTIRFGVGLTMLVFGGVGVSAIGILRGSHVEVIVAEGFEFLGVAVMVWAAYRMLSSADIVFRRGG